MTALDWFLLLMVSVLFVLLARVSRRASLDRREARRLAAVARAQERRADSLERRLGRVEQARNTLARVLWPADRL